MKPRPVLRYYGGKWKLAKWIIGHFPPHRVYVEPYGGGASVLLQKPRSYAEVYNDLWGDVVNVFRVLRDPEDAVELERRIRLTPFAREEFESTYNIDPGLDPIERARLMIFRSFAGHGTNASKSKRKTGFRCNCKLSDTTPATDWANYPDHIRAFTRRLQGVIIENRPAEQVILEHDGPNTLHYIDPPYPHETRSSGEKYAVDMIDDDHRRLAELLRSVKGYVVISGYPCDLYDKELYPDWQRFERISFADKARPRTEVLWLSPNCVFKRRLF